MAHQRHGADLMSGIANALLSSVASICAAGQNFLSTTTPPAWLDYSGITGNRMMYGATGNLTYAPNNILTYSNAFSNAIWNDYYCTASKNQTDPFGYANNAWTITSSATGAASQINQNGLTAIATGSKSYIASIYVKQGSSPYVYIQNGTNIGAAKASFFNLSNGTIGSRNVSIGSPNCNLSNETITPIGNGWYRISVVLTPNLASDNVYGAIFGVCDADGSRAVTIGQTMIAYGAQYEYATYNTTPSAYVATTSAAYYGPRFDYPNATAAGLLVEESRVNSIVQSNYFSVTWATIAATLAGSAATGPDGTTSAFSIKETTASSAHVLLENSVAKPASALPYTFSIYVNNSLNVNYVTLRFDDSGTVNYVYAVYNLVAGTVSLAASAAGGYTSPGATIQNIGNGWYRLTLTATTNTATILRPQFYLNSVNDQTFSPSYVGNASIGAYIFGAQLEQGTFATSYIPTGSAAVTRAADIIKFSGSALSALGGSAGTVIQQYNLINNPAATQYQIYGSAVSPLYFDSSLNVSATNGSNVLSSGVAATVGASIRSGLSWDGSGRSISVNGAAAVTDANSFGSIGSTIYLGSNNGANTANGHIEGISIYSANLASQLSAKTVAGASY
jgi:hypothetical protein